MSQEGHFDEEGLVDLFCGDCSFEEEVGVDDDDHKDNDCAAMNLQLSSMTSSRMRACKCKIFVLPEGRLVSVLACIS